ncbi:putative inositol polyphosphate 5-phosphatase C9G1.10c [Psilocybe cubensis]|uniref:Inositol polyphosphate 5-phosphatase C9G1.10c n=1 Tax=Psilocybe cubensis TaxID=181762 RepID=A0ACB8H6E7_PSICU|nr:putative inositol polyphosphate 5-phosphatase C9G1.10c [Psilocybe cubensis]KAH9483207.1 putative inositol polyphosphate 5-phosphatase C9G1.10c [Psilocybe cubensis]
MESSDIDSESLQAVSSLKSKFEKLALDTTSSTYKQGELLAVSTPPSPRPRAASGSHTNTPAEAISLRSSSSSSDLRSPLKRPPPPPPPSRNSKLNVPTTTASPSTSISPLLRPVPLPPVSNSAGKESALAPSIASLKARLVPTPPGSPSRTHSPRQSLTAYPALQVESKPTLPPRPPSYLPPSRNTASPEGLPSSSSVHSPFSDDEGQNAEPSTSKFAPPPIRQRQPHVNVNANPNGNGHGNGNSIESGSIRQLGAHFNDSSQSSYDSDASQAPPPQRLSRITAVPPPRPPPRSRPSVSPNHGERSAIASSVPTTTVNPPPPLPIRRSTIMTQDHPAAGSSNPPPLPTRSQISPANVIEIPTNERKVFGSSKLPPPPTRTIALGDKLPPARRSSTPSSDEESGEEDEPKTQAIDLMPDTSTSSRRPPTLGFRDGYPEPRVHVNPHSGSVALSGSQVVVAHGHHIKIYDLAISPEPTFNLDTKSLGVKDTKVTCMEFRPTASKVDRGYLVWIGTKEGHIFELDIRTGHACGSKYAAHMHPITHMFRHARSMITLDESGKALVFSPDPDNQEDITLHATVPRVIRTTEKQDFVKFLDGKLWTAARVEHHGTAPTQRLPIIRVYDVFNPASTGRSLMPSEHVGPVTSATIIPNQPRMVYVGHEEGFISMWELDTEDGFPKCVEVMKVSSSDVLSLEGVNNRLWAGSRNGMISAYDVSQKPWLVTNCWNAHPGLPVVKLLMNHYAVMSVGRLCVASIGRDEQLRLWDGLLGLDWIDKELVKVETTFSTFRDLTVLVCSWNCDSARPDSLNGIDANFSFLHDVLHSVNSPPDVIAFGFQEVIDLESRKMVAKNVLLGGKKKPEDGGLSEKVTGAYKRWYDRLILAVKAAMPSDLTYCVVHTESLVGLFSCIFVKSSERSTFDDVAVTTIKRGMGGRYGNKGGIVARFVVGDSSICFINCHLAAGQSAVRRRNADIAGMLEEKAVFPPADHSLAYVGGGDGSMVLDHEFVILNGDLNYRIDHRRDAIISSIHAGDLASLLSHDQLLREIKFNRGCRLRGFAEGPLTFNPTYKYDPYSNEYDTSEKHRSPAWCDRILWKTRVMSRVRQLHYRRYEANVSDHRPISAAFSITAKTYDRETREKTKAALEAEWANEQKRLLAAVTSFYVKQALI